MAKFVVNVAEIEAKGRKSVRFEVTSAWLSEALGDTEFRAPENHSGAVSFDLRMTGSDLLIEGNVESALVVPCARCNEPVDWPVEVTFTHLLSPLGEREQLPEELELTPEDLDRDYFSGEQVELDALVREHILLSVPMQPMHDEADCDPDVIARLKSAAAAKPTSPLAALAGLKANKDS
ncbi:MAG: DUF177 domain-containing protein [Myxococcota bacterium]